MKVRISEVRKLIRKVLNETISRDKYFLGELKKVLSKEAPELLANMGDRPIGSGYEHVVFSYGPDAVIKFRPTYEMHEEQAHDLYEETANCPDLEILESGEVFAYDEDEKETMPFLNWFVLPRYLPITQEERDTIDAVSKTVGGMPVSEVTDPKLRYFLEEYLEKPYDHSGDNVMKRPDGSYVIIDI